MKTPVSKIRRIYMIRLFGRCIALLICLALYILESKHLNTVEPGAFFKAFSPLHILWLIWFFDMACQLMPAKQNLALGSKKLFAQYFRPSKLKASAASLKGYIVSTTKAAYRVLILWIALIGALCILYRMDWIGNQELFMVSVFFYVCDLICVLIWCPFRLMMKNRCCTTCRIFNWDHMMMFTPMLLVNSFFSWSLLAMAMIVWIAWEASFFLHPERFLWQANDMLRCENCTDKLCTQYCQKLRK